MHDQTWETMGEWPDGKADYAASTMLCLIRKAQRAPVALQRPTINNILAQHEGDRLRTDMRERSTSAVRSSRSCPGASASHSVASLMDAK